VPTIHNFALQSHSANSRIQTIADWERRQETAAHNRAFFHATFLLRFTTTVIQSGL
jgi:hypothetical protein